MWTSQRDSQRAEYLADELGARAGGTPAAVRPADHLLITTAVDTVIRREARAGNGPPARHAAARTARTNLTPDVPLLRQVSRHTTVSLFASHPPSGLRADMLERRPSHQAAVTLTQTVVNGIGPHRRRTRTTSRTDPPRTRPHVSQTSTNGPRQPRPGASPRNHAQPLPAANPTRCAHRAPSHPLQRSVGRPTDRDSA
jgi:hypothetical protein